MASCLMHRYRGLAGLVRSYRVRSLLHDKPDKPLLSPNTNKDISIDRIDIRRY